MAVRRARGIQKDAVIGFLAVKPELDAVIARNVYDGTPLRREGILDDMPEAQAAIRGTVVTLKGAYPLEHGSKDQSLSAGSGTHVEDIHAGFHREQFRREHRSLVQKVRFEGFPELQPDRIALALQCFKQSGPAIPVDLFEIVKEFHSTNIVISG
jgi:hypothetical protein